MTDLKTVEQAIMEEPISEFAQKALIYLLRASEGLTVPVTLRFSPTLREPGREIAKAAKAVYNRGAVNNLLEKMRATVFFYGYDDPCGLGASLGTTLTDGPPERQLHFTVEEIQSIQTNI
ncbi:MAG: hypothetical protein A2365_00295 [Candidatus Nealsonbacteria bacterium RIFOXYB1_FULL_40_15]|uniref:Uncharacterized protein n=2 Tax=Candidatus Nealsoniibacteriota TaxID=1817911 RepID=A0A1G2ENP0_9BACT|nr:MAG: hypothetical protein A2365_00295 [Candidatus Nealsonbacteria bacterium RIFOXYB1_FULL_40_15]OGZ27367.1 MAG: hypothetical protein A2427_03455 [Candidatus Nealsonbacteria bacterium RIFOXYC1_FULL_40_7]OGZ28110.1 MAG: hypothetical protein A2562_00470 [Candidatus Nealsonbacteria bacterium RIFOXYD1_FULL_39_11]